MKNRYVGILPAILLLLVFANITGAKNMAIDSIKIENNTVYLNSLTLEQKIAQMFIIGANKRNLQLTNLNIGGIYLFGLKSEEDYKKIIEEYQNRSKIKLLVATDLEGYWNPFPFVKFPYLDEINTREEAYKLGLEHGKILARLGFNINFAPVAELEDKVWKHRAFSGSPEEISEKVKAYVKGLQEQGIMATLKHYPGGSLNIKDPHWHLVKSEISKEQLKIFESALNNVSAVMVGHIIVSGAINSKGKPSSVSREVISELRKNFDGLIISDDINMRSLRNKYIFNERKMIVDLVKAGNDVIIGDSKFNLFPRWTINKKIRYIKEAVASGEISEAEIDDSVKRILKAKGYSVE